MTTWVMSAGADERDYSDLFFSFGMAFVGREHKATMACMQAGDTVLLKRGVLEFREAGIVASRNGVVMGFGDREWLHDVDGWDLPAYCFVEWHVPAQPIPAPQRLRPGTIYETSDPQLIAVAQTLLSSPAVLSRPEPAPTQKIDDDALLAHLIRASLSVKNAIELAEALQRIRLLAGYYYHNWDWREIREHETRTFLVIPLLLALGWPEQQLNIELPADNRERVDIACFSCAYSGKRDDVAAILETKGFSKGLDYAVPQAHSYAACFPKCKVIIVTNGYCYKTFVRQVDGSFQTSPSAYLNLLRAHDRYPLDPANVGGALDVLDWLLPAQLLRTS